MTARLLNGSSPCMRRINGKVIPVWPGNVERVMDPAPADVGGTEALGHIITVRRLNIVHHQVERRRGAGLGRRLGVPDDDMRAAAEFEDREVGVGENRT